MIEKAKKPAVSLNHKIIIALFFVILFYAVLDSFLHHRLITPNFTALEEREATASITRCLAYLKQDLERLDQQNYEWSNWDETYDFVTIGDPGFVKRNLAETYLNETNLGFMYFHDARGSLVWGKQDSGANGQGNDLSPEISAALDYYLSAKNGGRNLNGIVASTRAPVLLSIKPILKSNGSGPVQGSVTIGRYLESSALDTISDSTLTNFSFVQVGGAEFPENLKYVQKKLSEENRFYFHKNYDNLSLYTFIPDIYGERSFLLSISNNREIISMAREAEKSAFNSVVIIGLIILISTFILIRVIVISPLDNLTRHIRMLQAEDYKAPVSINILHSDEIAVLTYEFNRLVNKLAESRKKLLVQSYYAGIGESSSVILHNIRNTLNPIVVNVDLLRLSIREISIEHLDQAVAEYTDPDTPLNRRKDIQEYLQLSIERFAELFLNFHKRLDQMIVQSGRLENILASQNKFIHIKPPIEQIQMIEVIKDSIDRLDMAAFKNVDINIDQSVDECGIIEVERINLMQVVEHVLRNAVEAINTMGIVNGRIEISGKTMEADPDQILLLINDNGAGVDPDKTNEIFQRGYTTKDRKSAGTGLHWCATTVNAMHGRIWVESKGKGTGASIYLRLPRFRDMD